MGSEKHALNVRHGDKAKVTMGTSCVTSCTSHFIDLESRQVMDKPRKIGSDWVGVWYNPPSNRIILLS